MSENVLEKIAFKTGDHIFSEGERGHSAFIIEEGEINIVKKTDQSEMILATVGKGSIIGEMALIDDSPRMATARAASEGTVVVVTGDMFNAKLEKTDTFVKGLLRILAEHLRRLSKENVSLHSRLNEKHDSP